MLPVLIGHFVPHTQRHKRAESIHYFFGCCCCCCCSYIPLSLVLIMITFNVLSFLRLGMCFLIWIWGSTLLSIVAHSTHTTRSLYIIFFPCGFLRCYTLFFREFVSSDYIERKTGRNEMIRRAQSKVIKLFHDFGCCFFSPDDSLLDNIF